MDHNDLRNFAPSEQHTKELEHIYESARRSRLCYASWLTPFDLHVTPSVSLRCQQCYARDPHAATTCVEINQCVGWSSGEEPAPSRYRAGVASMANAP